jgi:glycosyltransferase involved in cell wall biosynthesis
MKITVITVNYNADKTLGRTLESVAKQIYPNVEHILIDGGSTDNSMTIAKTFGAHLSKSLSESDKGIYDAMNKGLALATGDVVAFLNADDFYASNDILSHVAQLMVSNELDILTGNVAFFRSGSENKTLRIYNSGRFEIKKLALGLMPAHPALFIRRDILVKAGGFKADYKIAGDFELIARILTRQNIKMEHLSRILVMMQLGGISTSGWRAKLLMNREILRACSENKISTNLLKIWFRYPAKLLELKWF